MIPMVDWWRLEPTIVISEVYNKVKLKGGYNDF